MLRWVAETSTLKFKKERTIQCDVRVALKSRRICCKGNPRNETSMKTCFDFVTTHVMDLIKNIPNIPTFYILEQSKCCVVEN